MIWNGFDWVELIDADIRARRSEHAARLMAERARIARAKQATIDAVIVEAREARVRAGRGRAIVRALVES